QFLGDRALAPRSLTLGSNGAIRQAVHAGLGVSLLSRAAVEGDLASGRLAEIRLRDGVPARPWFVVRSAIGPVPWVVSAFVDFAVLATGDGAKFDQAAVR